MVVSPPGAEFDEIAEVYDATREPLAAPLVEALEATLRSWGARRLLEVGVGTGRVALPLTRRGFEVTGLDISRRMLVHARAKGLDRLVRGSALRLPLANHTLDAALFVHVLHVLDHPADAIAEACRVTRLGAAALVRPASAEAAEGDSGLHPRGLVVDLLRAEGVELPDRAHGGPPSAERKFLAEFPPDRLVKLSEEDVTEPVAEELTIFERRASRWTLRVPADQLARAVARARELIGDRTHTYHRVRALALWERPPVRTTEPRARPAESGGSHVATGPAA